MADAVWLSTRNRVTVAVMAGRSDALDDAAGRILRRAKKLAAEHVGTGNYIANLHIENVPGGLGTGRLVRDRLVVANDPASVSIEWGHLVRHKNSRRVSWVPPQLIMTRAAGGERGIIRV